MAGCVNESTPKIEGTVHNTIEDEKISIQIYYTNTGALYTQDDVRKNSTEVWELPVGSWDIRAYDETGTNNIDSCTLVLKQTDSSFTIIVYEYDIYATAS